MTKTTSFKIMGPRANCVMCGAWSRHAEVSACNRCLACSEALDTPLERRTKMQRHSNAMLFMRRMMKDIAKVMRVHQVLELERTGVMVSLDTEGHKEMAMAYALMVKEKLDG